ncbi:MAG: DEAD/DEAH box helicase [Actinobacteria bacterium]|nr:DEAD/DEAH box helicase [Actinomycetota bacterium]
MDTPGLDFTALGLRGDLLSTLTSLGYEEPTPIQAAAIPLLIGGADMLGQAATGTGKTAAFALPILERLDPDRRSGAPSALVLVPTRELALQVAQAFASYGKGIGVRLVAIYGGAPARQQIEALRRGVDVVIATPGRALDLCDRGSLKLDSVRTVVLDEADEMLEMGFIEDIETLLAKTPDSRQTVLFSATMPKRIDKLASRHLRNPERVAIAPPAKRSDDVPRVRQAAFVVKRFDKPAAAMRILDAEDPAATIIFCRTRGEVDDLAQALAARGYQAEALHGGLTQDQRDRVMGRLRSRAIDVLVATDVAARGLDVDHLSHVVNYDLPSSPEVYVHRIGRVGRAGREGVALSLVEPRERRMLAAIEKLIGAPIPIEKVPSIADVRMMRLERSREAIEDILDDPDQQARLESFQEIVAELLEDRDPETVLLAAFALAHDAAGGDVEDDDRELSAALDNDGKRGLPASWGTAPSSKGHGKAGRGMRDAGVSRPASGKARIWVSLGRKSGVTPSDIVGVVTGEAGLKGRDVGPVRIQEFYSLVDVPEAKARKVVKSLNHCTIRGRKAKVKLDQG